MGSAQPHLPFPHSVNPPAAINMQARLFRLQSGAGGLHLERECARQYPSGVLNLYPHVVLAHL